jgi:hypothetical protein
MPTSPPARSTSGNNNGCIAAIALATVLLVAVLTINTCRSPYWRAGRALSSDPCAAAVLYAEDVRRDGKRSMTSLVQLTRIPNPCALRELIGLMDLPEGVHTRRNFRLVIWKEVQRRSATLPTTRPTYDLDAPIEVRRNQQAQWREWYKRNHPAP